MNSNLLLKFYNEISGNDFESIDAIPKQVLSFLLLMDIEDVKKPFARRAVYSGKSKMSVAARIGVERRKVMRMV